MSPGFFQITLRSLSYNRRKILRQVLIIALLAAVITGSLLTGYSVRETLRSSIRVKLGSTRYIISSGVRYFSPALSERLSDGKNMVCTPILDNDGVVEVFAGSRKSFNTKIYGIKPGFFSFLGFKDIMLNQGEAAINENLARLLDARADDELIVSFTVPDDVPSGSPFAIPPAGGNSGVFKVSSVVAADAGGDFSAAVSQLPSMNIFIREDEDILRGKANRILVRSEGTELSGVSARLEEALSPGDIGLSVRTVKATGEKEIISSRIFIDQPLCEAVTSAVPAGKPVITYLVNNISKGKNSTPYSFVSGTDSFQPGDSALVINDWLAKDLAALPGDTLAMSWFSPSFSGKLGEKSGKFVIGKVVSIKGMAADSMLMPDFPGIAGSPSCSRWNAGIEIRTDRLRKKDEDYWRTFRGTPKAFLPYAAAKAMWGSSFGPATAIRFPSSLSEAGIISALKGRINPSSAGFSTGDILGEMNDAASQSIDFGTLFLSLGFFIILSSLILLVLSVRTYLDSRKNEMGVLKALGFRDRWIGKYLTAESVIISLTGSLTGSFAGILINTIMIAGLNSVWNGAVHTNRLAIHNDIPTICIGIIVTVLITGLVIQADIRRFLRLGVKKMGTIRHFPAWLNNPAVAVVVMFLALVLVILTLVPATKSPMASFSAGVMIFAALIILFGHMIEKNASKGRDAVMNRRMFAAKYYLYNPGSALMPVILIAAGLFAVVITGINRQRINSQSLVPSGGTGGYSYWIETSVPVSEDLNSAAGRKRHGLERLMPQDISLIQCKKSAGNDASCLNLNYIASPPLLGAEVSDFTRNRAFSFSTLAGFVSPANPWNILNESSSHNTIFGFADQTVLEWGLKKKTGDTLKFRNESGQPLNIVIAGGLKSSLFQGFLVIGLENFNRFYPSAHGYSVFLLRGPEAESDSLANLFSSHLENYGVVAAKASDRLSAFFSVTNTYLSVFTILGALGMILGVAGLGLVLMRTYNARKKEFALLVSMGYRLTLLRKQILAEQFVILAAGIFTGLVSGLVASFSSVSNAAAIPWISILLIVTAICCAGFISIYLSLGAIDYRNLIGELRKE